MSADAHHITQPSVEGPVRAMRMALRDAGVAAEAVDYINAHGTGTEANDPPRRRPFARSSASTPTVWR